VTCPSEGRLAAAVAGEDDGAADHAAACARCAAIVADGRAIRAALASLRAPSPRRQAAMLAEVLAEAERVAAPARRATPRGGWRIAAAAVVVAAMVTGAAAGVGAVRRRVAAQRSMAVEVLRPAAAPPGRVGAARAPARAAGVSAVAPTVPVAVAPPVAPAAAVAVVAPVAPVAPVAAASADAASPVAAVVEQRRRAAPERSSPRAPVAAPAVVVPSVVAPSVEASAPPSGVAAFRAGWEALRVGQPRVARAHFDRADDPAVREDAAYWAAVASERAGERLEAARRFRGFAQAYPRSPRAADARAAAARLYDQ